MRKEVRVTIEDSGNRLDFVIRQMPATKLEWWIFRALQCLGGALQVEDPSMEAVGKAFAEKGITLLQSIDPDKAKVLLDEMLATASRVKDGMEYPCNVNSGEMDGYIGDVRTLFKLRMECLKANLSFFGEGVPSGSQDVKEQTGSPTIRIAGR